MRIALVLAVVPALLLAYPAGAQVAVDQSEAQPSPAQAAPVTANDPATNTNPVKPPAVRWRPRPKVKLPPHPPVRRPPPGPAAKAPATPGGAAAAKAAATAAATTPGKPAAATAETPASKAIVPTAETAPAAVPPPATSAGAPTQTTSAEVPTSTPSITQSGKPATTSPAQTAPVSDVQASPVPPSAGATSDTVWIEPIAGAGEPSILLKTGPDVGLAGFRSGSEIVVVLDSPIDFRAPSTGLDPAFAQLTSRRTQDGTVIRVPLASGTLHLARNGNGWVITASSSPAVIASIVPRLLKGGVDAASVQFPLSEPSGVVTILDPHTGEHLLVGTQVATGQAVPNAWQQARFGLKPTLQGIVVVATSDDIRLHRGGDGFTLSTGPLADSSIIEGASRSEDSNVPIAGALSRLFDIPNGSAGDLVRNLDGRVRTASDAHSLARSEPRLRVAEAMLALGMDVEAQSVIDVAAAADPMLVDRPRAIGLRAVASLLAGRFDEANTLADPRLSGSAEIDFWRAYLPAAKDEATAADARGLSGGLAMAMAYPRPLRDRLLPTMLEAMALNGQAEAADAVLKTLPNDRTLDLARGMVLEMTNHTADALHAYDRLANSPDRLRRYKALMRATGLRMKTGELDARAGADILDRSLFGWRGPKQEIAMRIRIAGGRRQTGQWEQALAVLRDGRDAFPDDHAQIDRELATTFTAFITDDSVRKLPPAEFVAIYDKNAGLVQDISWDEKVGRELVDRLVGLGLQGRAEPIMMRLVAQSTDPVKRVTLGARLADLRITMDEPTSAIAALAETAPPAGVALDAGVTEARQLLYAHAESQRGNTDSALAMLNLLGTPKADLARADIYTARKDWPQVVTALTAWEHRKTITGNLTDRQRAIVTRLAVAAALSGDTATLDHVVATYGTAMATGSSAALFRVLTSAPVHDNADLSRAFQEIQLARQVSSNLGAMATP